MGAWLREKEEVKEYHQNNLNKMDGILVSDPEDPHITPLQDSISPYNQILAYLYGLIGVGLFAFDFQGIYSI